MVKPPQRAEMNSFGKGILTEASPLAFPDGAVSEMVNFEINSDGTIDRRLGFDKEFQGVWRNQTGESAVVNSSTFLWKSVGGVADKKYVVVQVNRKIHIFDAAVQPLSNGFLATLDVSPTAKSINYSYAAIDGRLVIAHGGADVNILSVVYNPNPVFSMSVTRLRVRDFWGIRDTVSGYETDPTFRGSLNDIRIYNLQNQSWGYPRKDSTNTFKDVLSIYSSVDSKFPSDSEVVWTGMEYKADGDNPYERVLPSLYKERFGEDVKAAKGGFIIDLLDRGASRRSVTQALYAKNPEIVNKAVTLPADSTPGGASCVCEYAGRVFYAGFSGAVSGGDTRSPTLNNFVAFSQIVKGQKEIAECYQAGDPTSRMNSDLVDTDGGFIRIAEAQVIVKLIPINKSLVILANNGVWALSGGSDVGFTPTAYIVTKISDFGCGAQGSVVTDGAKVLFLSDDGFYVLESNQYGDQQVNNISSKTVQRFFDEIPIPCRKDVKGFFDIYNRKVRWLYRHTTNTQEADSTYELVLDVASGGFSFNEIKPLDQNSPFILGMFETVVSRSNVEIQSVFNGVDTVYVGALQVGEEVSVRSGALRSFAYAVVRSVGGNLQLAFAGYNNTSFLDWEDVDPLLKGVDAEAYLLTGTITAGDSAVMKQTPYITTHMLRTEAGVGDGGVPRNTSSCLLHIQWEWTNRVESGRWSRPEQIYRHRQARFSTNYSDNYDTGYSLVTSKSKLRGRGRALAIYLKTEPQKDCRLLGWSLSLNGNSQ
jgi:hypothetical protein